MANDYEYLKDLFNTALEPVRSNLSELKADVKEATVIYEKLESVTQKIESLKGLVRFYENSVAYSTITITFQLRYMSQAVSKSPFWWINDLGLERIFSY